MNEWYEQAKSKLEAEKGSGSYDRYASAMKELICEKLCIFCKQDSEFAQAVVQGGAFADCMKTVAKGCGGTSLPDEEAIRRAVRFYFPGATVKFHMELNLCGDVEAEAAAAAPVASTGPKILDLEDFLYARVVATAPTRQQLNDVLWSEVAKWQSQSPLLSGLLKWTKTYVYVVGMEKRWFAVARTATKPENMQGFHEENMLFIVDEASGVAEPIMEAVLGTLSGPNNKLLLCGNPTKTSGTLMWYKKS